MRRHVVPCVVVLAILAAASALPAHAGQVVVLRSGATVEVASARIQGSQVFVTFPNGRMQAYSVEDVDLRASGLEAPPPPPIEVQATPSVGAVGLAAHASAPLGRFSISDADVGHVTDVPPGAAEESPAADRKAAATALRISGLANKIEGSTVTVTGLVTNTGGRGLSAVTLEAQAVNGEGAPIGTGRTTIAQPLDQNQGASFTIGFSAEGPVADVRVRAVAAVAEVNFETRPEAQPQAEGEPSEEPAARAQAPKPTPKPTPEPPSPNQWAPQGSSANQWAPTAPVGGGGGSGR